MMSSNLWSVYVGLLIVIQASLASSNPCGSDWTFDASSGNCYKIITTSLTWQQAGEECKRQGAELASIESEAETTFLKDSGIVESANRPGAMRIYRLWIGLNDIATEGQYVWSDGSSAVYRNWMTSQGQPTQLANQDCAMLITWSPTYQWYDYYCSTRLRSLCKKKGHETTNPGASSCCKVTGSIVTFRRNVVQASGGYDGCKEACDNDFLCIGWSYKNSPATCELNRFFEVRARDFESGPNNLVPDCDRYTKACLPSSVIENKKLRLAFISRTTTSSGDDCAEKCNNTEGCVRWFWNVQSKLCFLFREDYVSAPGWNSGTKPCD